MRQNDVLDLAAVYRDARRTLVRYVRSKCYWAGEAIADDIADETFCRLPAWTVEVLAQQGYLRAVAKRVMHEYLAGRQLDGRAPRIKARNR